MNLIVIVVGARLIEDKQIYNKSQGAKHYGGKELRITWIENERRSWQ